MRYLGNKESLTEVIIDMLRRKGLLNNQLVFCDAFCGMGAVSNAVKPYYRHIVINDILKCSTFFTYARLVAPRCRFEQLGFDPFEYFNNNDNVRHDFIYSTYSTGGSNRMYFSDFNAGRIDYFRYTIEEWYNHTLINHDEYIYLLACLLESVSDVSNTAGVYGAFLKHWDKRALKNIVFSNIEYNQHVPESVEMLNGKIEDIIQDIDCDILYLDPPYTQNQYGTQYHLLETLILNDRPTVSAVTGSRPVTPLRSYWSKEIHSNILFERVIAKTKARYILFSYNNDGFMSKDFITSTLRRYGKVETFEFQDIDYKKYENFKSRTKEGHKEYLFFIEKKPEQEVIFESPLNYTGSKAGMVKYIKQYLPKETSYSKFFDLFGGGFNVGINIERKHIIYNDINNFVVDLIYSFYTTDTYKYLSYIQKVVKKYDLGPLHAEQYYHVRDMYNSSEKRDPMLLYAIILFGFQQQIRFNSNHEFNNPCGSRKFNDKIISKFISFSRVIKTKDVSFTNYSFDDEEVDKLVDNQVFVYADPPYLSTTGVYNDGKRGFKGWSIEDEKNLCKLLDSFSERGSKFMLSYIIDNEGFYNANIVNWANSHSYKIISIPQPQGRYNNRNEILILNY